MLLASVFGVTSKRDTSVFYIKQQGNIYTVGELVVLLAVSKKAIQSTAGDARAPADSSLG